MELKIIRLQKVQMNMLTPTSFNPKMRTKDAKLLKLKEIIIDTGIILPLSVIRFNDIYYIVDGNRRYNIAKDLGLREIYINIIEGSGESIEKIFVALNEQMKMDSQQRIELARSCGIFITSREKDMYNKLVEFLGLEFIDLMIERQQGIQNLFRSVRMLMGYLKVYSREDFVTIAKYLSENRQCAKVRMVIETKINSRLLADCVINNKKFNTLFVENRGKKKKASTTDSSFDSLGY